MELGISFYERGRESKYHHKRKKSNISQKKNSFDGGPRAVNGAWALHGREGALQMPIENSTCPGNEHEYG
jgi:hypothetical protein